MIAWESPPQARGRRALLLHQLVNQGITSAGAGSSSSAACSRASIRNHPRRRGVVPASIVGVSSDLESPPQARGRRRILQRPRPGRGITPAGAGSSAARAPCSSPPGNHPRRRGVVGLLIVPYVPPTESPPQARGLRGGRPRRTVGGGITPAGAGTSPQPTASSAQPGNHPRRRGDFQMPVIAKMHDSESPPQARGLPSMVARPARASGITPAGAGTSRRHRVRNPPRRNHPRRRGDFTVTVPVRVGAVESPPQARGLPGRLATMRCSSGITPAGAGTSI